MSPVKISFKDQAFADEKGIVERNTPYINWDRNCENKKLCVYTDTKLFEPLIAKFNIAWLLEPMAVRTDTYEYILRNPNKFDLILTYTREFYENPILKNKIRYYQFGGCWVKPEDSKIYDKTKDTSIIASWKKMTEGHKLRHETIGKFKGMIDVYGNGYKFIQNKLEGHKDYRYSIIIENIRQDFWFTEKIIDAFACGSIPIYWGCPSIGNFFNIDGIITFNDLQKLECILQKNVSERDYNNRMKAIIENFNKVEDYRWCEKSIYEAIKEFL